MGTASVRGAGSVQLLLRRTDGEKRPMPGHRRRSRRARPQRCPGHGPAGAAACPPGTRRLPAPRGSGNAGMVSGDPPSPLRASRHLGRTALSKGSREGVDPQVYPASARVLGFLFLPPSPKTLKEMDGCDYL